ncbi:hypothetical protein FF1_042843 [Malus domestica]
MARRHGGGEEGEGEEKWREGNRWVFEADWRAEAPQHRRPQSLPQFEPRAAFGLRFLPGRKLAFRAARKPRTWKNAACLSRKVEARCRVCGGTGLPPWLQ